MTHRLAEQAEGAAGLRLGRFRHQWQLDVNGEFDSAWSNAAAGLDRYLDLGTSEGAPRPAARLWSEIGGAVFEVPYDLAALRDEIRYEKQVRAS